MFQRAIEAVAAKFKDQKAAYMVESLRQDSAEIPQAVILRGLELDFSTDLSSVMLKEGAQDSDAKLVSCANFCLNGKTGSPVYSAEVRNPLDYFVTCMYSYMESNIYRFVKGLFYLECR